MAVLILDTVFLGFARSYYLAGVFSIQKRNGGEEDEPLVRGRIKALAECEINQRREDQHVSDGDRVKRFGSHSRFICSAHNSTSAPIFTL